MFHRGADFSRGTSRLLDLTAWSRRSRISILAKKTTSSCGGLACEFGPRFKLYGGGIIFADEIKAYSEIPWHSNNVGAPDLEDVQQLTGDARR